MPDDTDVLALLAEAAGTNDPITLLQRLEAVGLEVTPVHPEQIYNADVHRASMIGFAEMLHPIWEQGIAIRTRLISDGWSDDMAEHFAAHIVHIWLALVEGQMAPDTEEVTS